MMQILAHRMVHSGINRIHSRYKALIFLLSPKQQSSLSYSLSALRKYYPTNPNETQQTTSTQGTILQVEQNIFI